MTYLLDTNIVTAIVKKNEKIIQKCREVELQGGKFFISCITYYEIKRGLLAINATRQISNFTELCQKITVLLLDDLTIIERASAIHADLKKRGRPIQDTDILIASTAITHGLILVSNDSDMFRIQGITIENWLS